MTVLDYMFFWLGCTASICFPALYSILFRPFRNWIGRLVMLHSTVIVLAYLKGALTVLTGNALTVNLSNMLLNLLGAVMLSLESVLIVWLKLHEDEDDS